MIVVVSAVPAELAGFGAYDLFRGAQPSPPIQIGTQSVVAGAVGVGPLAAAAGTARLLRDCVPDVVVFVGTAGVFEGASARFPLESAVVARETALVDLAVVRNLAERPPVLTDHFLMSEDWSQRLAPRADQDGARVATTTAITVDDGLARELAAAGYDLENLELAGVAAACAAAGVPCAGVLGVSNVVGARGRAEWRAHRDAAERAACALVLSALGA